MADKRLIFCAFALQLCFVIMIEIKMMQFEASTEKNCLDQNLVEDLFQAEADAVLKPPYRIAIFGEPRTGSTFMHQLLYAIVRIKTPPEEEVSMLYNKVSSGNFVSKCHKSKKCQKLRDLVRKNKASIFISTQDKENVQWTTMASSALYMQETVNLHACSLCEVDAYKHIFGLTDVEIQRVKDYMATYEIIRQCCGMQMSRWERMRLHGCNITEEDKARPDYVQCDHVDKRQVELKMASNPGGIKYAGMHPRFNWMEVGDCEKFDSKVISGKDFNGFKFKTSAETCNALRTANVTMAMKASAQE